MTAVPLDGRMSWADAVAGPLAGATCLWQDLDGLHVASAPDEPPRTSILWGWREDALLVRLRLDGDVAYVAVHQPDGHAVATVPWNVRPDGDGRVAASRGPSAALGGAGAGYEQIVVDGAEDGTGPVTFIRLAGFSGGARGREG